MKIEHKIIKEKDYLAVILVGGIWVFIAAALNLFLWWATTSVGLNRDIATISFTLFFCYGLYCGRDFFKPVIREEVIHVIK